VRGARDWSGSGEVKAAALDESLAVTDKAYGAFIDHSQGDILVGYSRGAFVARDVVYARPGRFRGLILLGALMRPDAARLKASGIRRVVFAAGEWDMARPAMQRSAAALTGAGLPSRYVSLGQIGHALPITSRPSCATRSAGFARRPPSVLDFRRLSAPRELFAIF
jgi:predicted esterase